MKVEGMREAVKVVKALKDKMDDATSKALNRVGEGVMTEANRKVRETYQIKASEVKGAMKLVYSSASSGEVIIKASSPNLPLTRFRYSPKNWNPRKPKPVKVEVRKGESKTIRSAYIRNTGSKVMVMKRKFPTGQSGAKRRKNAQGNYPELPVEELRSPAVAIMMNAAEVIKHVEDQAEDRMYKRIDHEVGRILK